MRWLYPTTLLVALYLLPGCSKELEERRHLNHDYESFLSAWTDSVVYFPANLDTSAELYTQIYLSFGPPKFSSILGATMFQVKEKECRGKQLPSFP